MFILMQTNPTQLVLGVLSVILICSIIYVDHHYTGIIDSVNIKLANLWQEKIQSDKHVEKLNTYVDSVEVKANQVSQYADSVRQVSDETIEENNRLKIQLTEKESLIKKYKFENNQLIDSNECLNTTIELNGMYIDHYSDSIKILREEVNKKSFVIEELKSEKDSLIQQIINYKAQNDAVNQLIKDKSTTVLTLTKGFGKSGAINMISKETKPSKRKRHG